jgi:hypothetical protein
VSTSEQCGDALGRQDLTGGGVIDPRVTGVATRGGGDAEEGTGGISVRIVNRPLPNNKEEINSCPAGLKSCCYDQGTAMQTIY